MFKIIGFLLPFVLYCSILLMGFKIVTGMKEEKKNKTLCVKPPIGIVPEEVYNNLRILNLSRAINRYVEDGYFKGEYKPIIFGWLEELDRRLRH